MVILTGKGYNKNQYGYVLTSNIIESGNYSMFADTNYYVSAYPNARPVPLNADGTSTWEDFVNEFFGKIGYVEGSNYKIEDEKIYYISGYADNGMNPVWTTMKYNGKDVSIKDKVVPYYDYLTFN